MGWVTGDTRQGPAGPSAHLLSFLQVVATATVASKVTVAAMVTVVAQSR